MNKTQAIACILSELSRAESKFPAWPEDIVHAAAIVAEESGELVKASLDYFYCRTDDIEEIKKEAIQTAAMAIRLFINLKEKP